MVERNTWIQSDGRDWISERKKTYSLAAVCVCSVKVRDCRHKIRAGFARFNLGCAYLRWSRLRLSFAQGYYNRYHHLCLRILVELDSALQH